MDDLKSLQRLWPNRTHESNWFKTALCAMGMHRWYRMETTRYRFCRWCPKVQVGATNSWTDLA
jgi:hypothetical protein